MNVQSPVGLWHASVISRIVVHYTDPLSVHLMIWKRIYCSCIKYHHANKLVRPKGVEIMHAYLDACFFNGRPRQANKIKVQCVVKDAT